MCIREQREINKTIYIYSFLYISLSFNLMTMIIKNDDHKIINNK